MRTLIINLNETCFLDDVWNGHGGYMGLKKQKLVQQYQEQAQNEHKEKGIFSG